MFETCVSSLFNCFVLPADKSRSIVYAHLIIMNELIDFYVQTISFDW